VYACACRRAICARVCACERGFIREGRLRVCMRAGSRTRDMLACMCVREEGAVGRIESGCAGCMKINKNSC
jgi:hypothetical protein